MTALSYRLRVWPRGTAPADVGTVTPLLDVASDPAHAAPWIGMPPTGDGRSIDWVAGTSTVGSYTVRVLDPATGSDADGEIRLVTAALADAGARQQLGGCPALVEYTRGTADPAVLVAGVCTAARLAGAAAFDIAIGDARRAEATGEVWGSVSPAFRAVTCLIGGPVAADSGRGFPLAGGATLPDAGPQRWRVVSTDNATGGRSYRRVTLQFVRGPVKPSYNIDSGAMGQAGVDELNLGASTYFETSSLAAVDHAYGWYPRLVAELRTPLSVPEPRPAPVFTTPLSAFETSYLPESLRGSFIVVPYRLVTGPHAQLNLIWPAGPALPATGAEYDLLLYPADVSEHNPLHIVGHLVDVITRVWDDGGQAYDATAAAAARAALGELWVALRITKAMKRQAAVEMLCGFAGLVVTFDAQARRVLKVVRAKRPPADPDAPLESITLADLRDPGQPFDLAESAAITAVTCKTARFLPGASGDAGSRPLDALVEQKYERTATTDDPGAIEGEHTQTYTLPGTLLAPTGVAGALVEVKLDDYVAAQGRDIFDRRSRGAITGTLAVGPGIVAAEGDEVLLDLPHRPTATAGRTPTARRGGPRVVLVTRRTEVPGGADLAVEDLGTEAQPALTPTLTLGAGADPRSYVVVTLTNRAALATAGDTIRVEARVQAVGDAAPDAATAGVVVRLAPATDLPDALALGPVDAGARLYVRVRAERVAHRASPFSAWVGRTLTALAAPTGLSVAVDTGDPSALTATLTVGEVDQPVEALVARSGETAEATRYRWQVFPAGSTRLPLTREAADDGSLPAVIVHVRHRQASPLAGVSAEATASVASGAASALAPPTDPRAFAGTTTGAYGLDVTAGALPSDVEVYEAVETAAGAGTFGAPALRATTPALVGTPTRVTLAGVADGRKRRLTARHVRLGATPSAFTASVDVVPYTASAPTAPPPPTADPDLVPTAVYVTRLTVGTDCTTPATLRLTLALPAPLAAGRTLTVTDPMTGDVALSAPGDGATSSWTPTYSAHGYGTGAGSQLFAGAYTITRDSDSAVLASDSVATAGDALATFCPV